MCNSQTQEHTQTQERTHTHTHTHTITLQVTALNGVTHKTLFSLRTLARSNKTHNEDDYKMVRLLIGKKIAQQFANAIRLN